MARSSGVRRDIRKDEPYLCFKDNWDGQNSPAIDFKVPVMTTGDVYARYLVRLAELRESLARLIRYYSENASRKQYDEYLRLGYGIGSGAVESACKTVVGQRLKLAGMRWGEDGADAVCHLRALYRSDGKQWDAFWNCDLARN